LLAYSPGVAFPRLHIHPRWHRSRCSILRTARFHRVPLEPLPCHQPSAR
jgi:hypothetical protein